MEKLPSTEVLTDLIKGDLVRVINAPEVKQGIFNGRGINIVVAPQIVGDSAIEKAMMPTLGKMLGMLMDSLPEPKFMHLKALALVLMREEEGSWAGVATRLGMYPESVNEFRARNPERIETMEKMIDDSRAADTIQGSGELPEPDNGKSRERKRQRPHSTHKWLSDERREGDL